jgi:hypothetical protein
MAFSIELEEELAKDFAEKYGVYLKVIGCPEYKKYFIDDERERFV